jgi:isocitrate/isopropylmalate dehydrogenase
VGSPLPYETIDSIPGAMMLDHIGEDRAAERIRQAVESVLKERRGLTPDIGGHSTTLEMTQAIIRNLE